MIDVFLDVVRVSNPEYGRFMWKAIGEPFITKLLDKASPDSLNRVIALVSPYILWDTWTIDENIVKRWVVAVTAFPYTEEVGRSVVDALM